MKRPWCWERLKAKGEGGDRRWGDWRHPQLKEETPGESEGEGSLGGCRPWGCRDRQDVATEQQCKVRFSSAQFSSVAQSYLTLCDPMNRSTPGLPVHHQLPESTQTHVHWVSDAIQPSHPLSSLLLSSKAMRLVSPKVIKSLSLKGLPIPWHFNELFKHVCLNPRHDVKPQKDLNSSVLG